MNTDLLNRNNDNVADSGHLTKMLRSLDKDFKENIKSKHAEGMFFTSKSNKKRSARARAARQKNVLRIRFTSFAQTLGVNFEDYKPRKYGRRDEITIRVIPPTPGPLVSVFILAFFPESGNYHFQKVAKKSAPGLPGGSIEGNEAIFMAAAREYVEETCGAEKQNGVDISSYPLTVIGDFELSASINREVNGRGVLVFVELPESEKANITSGGGISEEGESITDNYFWTFEEVQRVVDEGRVLRNSIKAWTLYIDYLLK